MTDEATQEVPPLTAANAPLAEEPSVAPSVAFGGGAVPDICLDTPLGRTPGRVPTGGRKRLSVVRRERLLHDFGTWGYDNRGWTPATRDKYQQRVRALEKWLTENKGKSVLWASVKDLRAWLFAQSPHPRTRNGYRQAAVAFFAYLVDSELVEVNVALALPRLPEPEHLSDALTREQARAIETAVLAFPADVQALVGVFLYLGLRKDEARLLEWVRLDLVDGWARFTAKGRRERVLPINAKLGKLLKVWRMECPDPQWVFPSRRHEGRVVSKTWVRYAIRQVGAEVGLAELHPHQLRHTMATRLVEQDVHIRTIQELLGHRDLKTTMRYLRVRPVNLRGAIEKLDYDETP